MSAEPSESWSSSLVTLIYKSGDTSKTENFRMIALTSCVAKIYHQILSERTSSYLTSNGLLDPETQKAFLRGINGCAEHTIVMSEIIAYSKTSKRTAHITFFDLADAFGSVEHPLIIHTLERKGIPTPVAQYIYIANLYASLNGTVRGPKWSSEPFRFNKGVFQGDPLSPIIFLIVFDPIIQHLKIVESQYGYDLNGTRYITLPFADDFCLITTHKRTHQRLMNELSELTASMNLTLKPVKCKSSMCSGKPKAIEFSSGDNKLKSIQDAPEKFLGVLITLYNKTSDHFEVVKSKLNFMIENINVSLLRNEFKLRVYNEYSVPSIRHLLMTHELTDTQLNSLDKFILMWLNPGSK